MKAAEHGWKKAQRIKSRVAHGANANEEKMPCGEVEVVMVDDDEGWTVVEKGRKTR